MLVRSFTNARDHHAVVAEIKATQLEVAVHKAEQDPEVVHAIARLAAIVGVEADIPSKKLIPSFKLLSI